MLDIKDFVRSGDGIWWGQGSAEPTILVNQLLDVADDVGPLRLFCGLTWNERLSTGLPEQLSVLSYGGLGELRHLSKEGRLEVLPCHYSALPRLFADGRLPADVGLVQVSPPDTAGTVTLGIGVDYAADAIPYTGQLIAEINHRMPTTEGGPRLPLSAFAATIETDRSLVEAPMRSPDSVDRRIAEYVATLVDDGDTLQIGVGSLPDAVLDALSGHKNLGFHSGMITAGVLDLAEQGVITGVCKEADAGLMVTGTAVGTQAFYERLADFPVAFRAASYTHAPEVLTQLRSLVSVNSALEVDLLGQVGAEMARGTHVGAVGGQVDFGRAASLTGARSIIALRSTLSHGESKIVPRLQGGVVTTARADVDAVATEHGVAMLTGCTVAERAVRLIEIAAPEHRDSLRKTLYGGGSDGSREHNASGATHANA